ncbi:MAG: hypothetical protein UZ07_CHB004003320, partial [Chlorobi bacterium OLB7]
MNQEQTNYRYQLIASSDESTVVAEYQPDNS